MRGIETIRKTGRVLLAVTVLAFATLVIVNGTGVAGVPHASPLAPAVEAVNASLAVGGAIRMCALAIGLVVGGILGMGVNPLGGATAISLGLHLGLATC
jgi:cytochrome c oxidase assembly factor CtaG